MRRGGGELVGVEVPSRKGQRRRGGKEDRTVIGRRSLDPDFSCLNRGGADASSLTVAGAAPDRGVSAFLCLLARCGKSVPH